tara:strand:- start:289 stop:513 length:225 start_codon:yes stop_codon:yes gene_type:complete
MNYFEYSLICLVLVLIVGITWLYYDLAAMTSRKEEWRLIALERERIRKLLDGYDDKMAKRLTRIFDEVQEMREG